MNINSVKEILSTLEKNKYKLTSAFLLFTCFSYLFPKQAKSTISASEHLIESLLPKNTINYFHDLHFSTSDFNIIWKTLLFFSSFCLLWSIVKFLALPPYNHELTLEGENLFLINSLLTLLVITYNKLSNNPIKLILDFTTLSNIIFSILIFITYILTIFYSLAPYLLPFLLLKEKIEHKYKYLSWIIIVFSIPTLLQIVLSTVNIKI